MALAFRQGLLLADVSKAMLSMDRWPRLRDRALAALDREPRLFAGMLAAHLGEQSLSSFLLRDGARLGWRLLMPLAATAS